MPVNQVQNCGEAHRPFEGDIGLVLCGPFARRPAAASEKDGAADRQEQALHEAEDNLLSWPSP
jgi:hypothetical protein